MTVNKTYRVDLMRRDPQEVIEALGENLSMREAIDLEIRYGKVLDDDYFIRTEECLDVRPISVFENCKIKQLALVLLMSGKEYPCDRCNHDRKIGRAHV